jgi:hypothetical protein
LAITLGILRGDFQTSRCSWLPASSQGNQCKIRKIKLAISAMAVTPATESTNACVAAW